MSSSHPSSRSGRPGPCPSCGAARVEQVIEDVTLRIGRQRRKFAAVPHERCLACGERIFGIDASNAFDLVLRKSLRRRAA